MNTWHPYPNHRVSAHVLSARHLGQTLGDCTTLIFVLSGELPGGGKQYDSLVQMWAGSEHSLCLYTDAIVRELHQRGYYEEVPSPLADPDRWSVPRSWQEQEFSPPVWLGDTRFHCTQRASLLASDPEWYAQMAWDEPARRQIARTMPPPRPGDTVLCHDGRVGLVVGADAGRRSFDVWVESGQRREAVAAEEFAAGDWRRCQRRD
jgi:hypothetical protein